VICRGGRRPARVSARTATGCVHPVAAVFHSPAPCGRGLGGGVCARQRTRDSQAAHRSVAPQAIQDRRHASARTTPERHRPSTAVSSGPCRSQPRPRRRTDFDPAAFPRWRPAGLLRRRPIGRRPAILRRHPLPGFLQAANDDVMEFSLREIGHRVVASSIRAHRAGSCHHERRARRSGSGPHCRNHRISPR
jgi:hypothetical protein